MPDFTINYHIQTYFQLLYFQYKAKVGSYLKFILNLYNPCLFQIGSDLYFTFFPFRIQLLKKFSSSSCIC